MSRNHLIIAVSLLIWAAACTSPPPEWQAKLDDFVRHEMAQKGIPGISITIVEGTDFMWSKGFGPQDEGVSGETVYRVASVSKLFTALAVMQLVEQGRLDLDAPVTDYVSDFRPHNPFERPITLRQLITHQSGLVREPPIGNYFDDTEPGLQATVRSLNQTSLVLTPETTTKYSNAAVSVAGYVVEQVAGTRFEEHMQSALIDKLGMTNTSFYPRADLREQLGAGYMWRYDTSTLKSAPVFELGIGPAANLYTTTDDLARFVRALFAIGRDERPDVLSSASLQEMWTPQFAPEGTASGFGLGFYVSRHDNYMTVGHAGVMYGYATRVWALPERDLGVAIVSNVDASNPVADRIARYALSLVLASRDGAPLPTIPRTTPVDSLMARSLDGTYVSGDDKITLIERNGKLLMDFGVERYNVRKLGDRLINDGRLGIGSIKLAPRVDTLDSDVNQFVRQPVTKPPEAPEELRDLIGEYGWDHNVLYVYEDGGTLHALIEWFFRYPLGAVAQDVYQFPDAGLYMHEALTFLRDSIGQVTEANLVGVPFKRRDAIAGEGKTFRIVPQEPNDVLRRAAADAQPPVEEGTFKASDLVSIPALDSTIRLDIRYATSDNFMGTPFYQSPQAFLQRPAAEALVRANQALASHGYGLMVYDGYRPWRVTKMFWDATPDSLRLFVADPSRGSRHNRGCAVDLGLYDLASGSIVEMPSGYDEFTARAYPDYPGGTALSRYHRELLRDAMEDAGFAVYEAEWWHFDYKDWRAYPIINETFENLN